MSRVTLDPDPLRPDDFGSQWMGGDPADDAPRSPAILVYVLLAVIVACVVGLAWLALR